MDAFAMGTSPAATGLGALLAGCVVALGANALLKRRGHPGVAAVLGALLAAALVAARIAWVLRWWPAYRLSPWSMLDLRDGGFAWIAGVLVLVFGMLVWARRRPALRRVLPVSAACGLAAWALVGVIATQVHGPRQPPLPAVALQQLDGRSVGLAALGGRPLVINLWATWCPPCRAELPMLVRASRDQRDVRFVFVNQGESRQAIRAFLARAALAPAHVLVDGSSELARYYRAPAYPTTLFVDASGTLVGMQVGPLSEAALRARLGRITAAPSNEPVGAR